MDAYIYTTTDSREVQAIINRGNFLVMNLSMQDGRKVQTDLGLGFNPSSYIVYPKELFSDKEIGGIVKKLIGENQFVAVANGQGIKQYNLPRGSQ